MADESKINLQKSYSALNERLAHQFDESGVKRSFTVPYIDGQPMEDHISAVGQAASQSGGLTSNLITTAHHSTGKGWGSGDGHTTGHPSDKLRTTVILKDDEHAKATIAAAQRHLNNLKTLLGEKDPTVRTAQGQLDLVKKADGAGMSLLDFGVMMTQIMYAPTQAVARAHSGTKEGGHAPHLRAPGTPAAPEEGQESQEAPPGEEQAESGSEAQPVAPEAAGAPQSAPAAPEAQST
jgi:hypothetical protein